jgi:Toprim domain-containing protein/primase-helicase-like zinc-binding protein
LSAAVAIHLPCPSCKSSDAYSEYDDGHGFCFSCNQYFPNKDKVDNDKYTFEYLPWRGISTETFRFYDVLSKIDSEGNIISLGFPYNNGSYKIRRYSDKAFYSVGDINKGGLFGRNKFAAGSAKFVTITEGEMDACSIYQVCKGPVVSVSSASSALRDCTSDRDWLNSFDRIILAFDSDAAGREATKRCARLFDYNKVSVLNFAPRKDANDFLQHGEGEQLKKLWWNAKKYLPETVISSFHEFANILKETPPKGVPYPWPTLDSKLGGIRTSESVLITAQEGVGKTEVMHALEYQLLKETDDAIGAIFLEEDKAHHLRAIAGLQIKRPVHDPANSPPHSEICAALESAIRLDDRLHLYSHFGSDDPEILLDTIRFLVSARACRYILLDHITMAVSGLGGESERTALDYLISRLEMMVKELKFALIIVSHVNDFGQTRGSRLIGKVCDIRIDLDRDVENSSNVTHLKITKNRPMRKTGPAGSLFFDEFTNTYTEVSNDNKKQFSPNVGVGAEVLAVA